MSQKAYIKFVEGSAVSTVTLDELKQQLLHYREQTAITGRQLNWEYADAAFPYSLEEKPEGEGKWFYLKGKNNLYKNIVFGVDSEANEVHIVLPDNSTHGDKAKGNEFCKYLAKIWKAELHLFNGRMMYYDPRK